MSSQSNFTYGVSEDIWASMRPRRVEEHEEPRGSDARMVAAYKKAHASDTPRASSNLAIIQRGRYCSKCLLHVKVCRTYGENLMKAEKAAAVLKSKNMNAQPEAREKEKGELQKAKGGAESKENSTLD